MIPHEFRNSSTSQGTEKNDNSSWIMNFSIKEKKNDLAFEKLCVCVGLKCSLDTVARAYQYLYMFLRSDVTLPFFFHTLCVLYLLFLRITVYVFLMRKKIKKEKAKKKSKGECFSVM